MTKARSLLAELHGRGVALRVVGDRLRYRPLAAVTPALQECLESCKSDLVALLERFEERAAILEYDAGTPRVEAERRVREVMLGGPCE